MSTEACRIYRYVVRHDAGTAPRPFGGICSLAICKPAIRAAARVGDWIIGFRSRHPGEVLFVMRVSERLTLGEYWTDARFAGRRPGASACPDNIYRLGAHGELQQVPNVVHLPHDAAADIKGRNALLADCFWYFGGRSVPLPNHLMHLVHTGRGHAVHKNRRAGDSKHLVRWLAAWPPGIHGQPVDAGIDEDAGGTEHPSSTRWVGGSRVGGNGRLVSPNVAGTCGGHRSPRRAGCNNSEGSLAGDTVSPRKLVLSRKGFDARWGGMPSPILPDGKLLPLPIPVPHDKLTLADLNTRGFDLGPLLADLRRGRHSLETTVHIDPDLDRKPELRLPGWRPALGQSGSAQSHLASQGVGAGDVMLFFGWFRQVEQVGGRWRYAPRAPNLHVLFGWLEIAEVWAIVEQRAQLLARHSWSAAHPHVASPEHYKSPRNTLYIAPEHSTLVQGYVGGGVFSHFSKALQLTADGAGRSQWSLPRWFLPKAGRQPLTYHGEPSRWISTKDGCRLQTVAIGQEFVLDIGAHKQAVGWIRTLLDNH